MADEFQRNKLYEYGANSNLVLEAERDGRRREDEGKGEVETLNGKLTNVRMGDRIKLSNTKPEYDNELEKSRVKRTKIDHVTTNSTNSTIDKGINKKHESQVFVASKGSTILSQLQELESNFYRPKTRETRDAYEELLRLISELIGDQPHDVLKGAADEVLTVLKSDTTKDSIKQKEISSITDTITTEKFHKLMSIGKRITDYHTQEDDDNDVDGNNKVDEEMAVVFDDDEEEGAEFLNEEANENDDEDDDERDGEEAVGKGQLKGREDDEVKDIDDQYTLSIHDIDAFWLQRQLSKFYEDANTSAKLADETLAALSNHDERVCENKLVVLLDFDKFDFIKLLMKNRAKIYYCVRHKQAQTDEERVKVEEEMLNDTVSQGPVILQMMKQKASAESWTQDRIGEFADKARREARKLNKSRKGEDEVKGQSFDDMDVEPSASFLADTQLPIQLNEKPISLEDLSFRDGGHLMTNQRCELPEKSWRAQKKGYEEVHVPAVKAIVPPNERLVEIVDLPEWVQPAFAGIRSLNRIQSKMVSSALHDSKNLLLCAPTGAGKTNVALLCMLNIMNNYRKEDGTLDLDGFKIVYIAPMKALVQECVQSFGKRLATFGITVKELSGDQNLTRQQIQDTQIIITTPEKWDIITRKAGDRTYTQLVRLMIIDEIHLLHDDRGPVLESLVARTIRQVETTQEQVRLVGLSATLPNYEDVAAFLRVDPDDGLFFFDSSYRPVPLQQQYIGITEKKALKRFQLMNEICYEKVLQQAGRNQVLIFTHSRAETAKTAKALRDLAANNDTLTQFVREDSASLEILKVESATAKNADLKDLLPYGFAIHHAGMVRSDRTLVEDLFADKHVQVLVSTATLAWGVNLPCHTVILKGTQMYSPEQGRWVELSPLDIMQMMGRAGRYGLDSEGEGIIMTQHSELQYYLSLMNQQLPIESQFIKWLPDMLNGEIVLGSISSTAEAAAWLGYTYLYVRMLRNPKLYGVDPDDMESDPTLLKRRTELAHAAAVLLDKHELIKYDRKTGLYQSTILGRVASHYYISHESIHIFNENMKSAMTDIEIFRLFSLSGEFKQIHVREEEKLELQKLVARVPIPIKESVEEPSAKVNVLLQAYISRLKLEGFALVADMTYIQQSACRLMRALFEIALKRGWAALSAKLLTICKMVERRIWSSQSPLRQIGSIPEVIIRKLEKNSDISWERYYDLKPQDLGEMVKIPRMGKTLYKFVHVFPKVLINAHVLPITRSLLKIDLTVTPDFEFDTQVHDSNLLFWIIVEDVDGERILHHEPLIINAIYGNQEHLVNFTVPMQDPLPPQYFIKVVSDRWLHSEAVLPVSFRHLILPQKYPPPTELLDLQPLPVKALKNSKFEELYKHLKFFNPIQTQTFSALYETDDNVLVCAPTGCGKTYCAEFAMLRLFTQSPEAKCVYIVPKTELAESTYQTWLQRLEDKVGKTTVLLTGETTTDLNLIEVGDVIITTALNWDIISRRWKQRKTIQSIALYVFDELHLVGGVEGPTYEIVVSRARFVASQLDRTVRIVGLSTSLANAKDVGDWIGATAHNTFNFPPHVRPVPLDFHMINFDTNHFSSRILAMAKPAFTSIIKLSPQKPVIVFVPSRKQAQLTAIDLITYASNGTHENAFVKDRSSKHESIVTSAVESLVDTSVGQLIMQGVGYLHNTMNANDRRIVVTLFTSGLLQVLVVPHDMCWSLDISCHLVIIMDTMYYEGREHRYIDYTITDILQMTGRASRQLIDASSKCVVMYHSPKKEYLRKLLHDPLPIESHLDHYLHDHINAEVVTKTIENKSDAVDYLTWTFYYRRLTQNPNYYGLQGFSNRHLSDHLSELVENVITDLEESKCLSVEDELDLTPLNLGMIASYYYIEYTTIELFASSLTSKSKIKGLLEILSSASEYSRIPIRQNEEALLTKLSKHMVNPLPATAKLEEPATKALILFQAHFSRIALVSDLAADQKLILGDALKLLQALVDVISSQGWLKPALAVMELSQMMVQGIWDKDSPLLQIPHFTGDLIAHLKTLSIETVFDVIDMDDEVREKELVFPPQQLSDIALFCNSYPNVELNYELAADGEVSGNFKLFPQLLLTKYYRYD